MASHLLKKEIHRPDRGVIDGVFIKRGLDNFDNEVIKSKKLHEISLLSSKFVAPKVLSFCQADRSISFEYIKNLNSVRIAYLNYMRSESPSRDDLGLIVMTGTILAEIHDGLTLKNSINWVPSSLFCRAFRKRSGLSFADVINDMPWAVAHCDYGFSNILFVEGECQSKELVVIDPSMNGFVTKETNLRAPIYIDLANLISCIYGLVPTSNYRFMHWRRLNNLVNSIVAAYTDRSGHPINMRLLDGMVYATAKSYFKSKYRFPISSVALWALFTKANKQRLSL